MSWVTRFGEDPWSWNLEPYDEDEEVEGDGSGMPGVKLVASAIVVWLGLQGRAADLAMVADTFSLPPELVRQAVADDDNLRLDARGAIHRNWTEPAATLLSERDPSRWTPYDLSSAIGVWASLRGDTPTIATAALVFMIPPARVRQAVEEGYWMFVGAGDVIEQDGE